MSDAITASDAARAALDAAGGGSAVAIVAAIEGAGAVRRMIVRSDETVSGSLGDAVLDETGLRLARNALHDDRTEPGVETVARGAESWLLYVEVHRPPERLIIVGAGHIAVPLAHVGRLLDFAVTVLDDREEFATTQRFDDDVVVLRTDFNADPFAGVSIDADSYITLVTRGHRWDFDCLRRLVELDVLPRYIGMIGSRRRVRAALHALLQAGTPREILAAIRAPIGIEIEAETPAEIAVAIAAELIAVRRGADIASISTRERVLERFLSDEE